MMVGGAPNSINLPLSQCVVPAGINGPVALWITSDDDPLINNVIDRATTQQVAGPAILFVDSSPEMIGQLVRGSGSSSGATSTETTTISPDEASSIIAGSSATATASPSSSSDTGSNGAAAPPPASTPLPANYTGPSPDGKTTVDGIQMVPNPNLNGNGTVASGSASGSAALPTDSASASVSATDSAASASASSS